MCSFSAVMVTVVIWYDFRFIVSGFFDLFLCSYNQHTVFSYMPAQPDTTVQLGFSDDAL